MNFRYRSIATYSSLVLLVVAMSVVLVLIVRNDWSQSRTAAVIALLTIVGLLRFPSFAPMNGRWKCLGRTLAALAGLAGFLSVYGFWSAFGHGIWRISSAGFVIGLYCTSLMLVRYGVSGVWSDSPDV
jgi:hypothetical protein